MCCRLAKAYIAASQRMNTGTGTAQRVEILLVEDNVVEITATLNALKKANISNKIHVLRETGAIMDFIFRRGVYQDQAPLPPETLILISLSLSADHGIDILRKLKADERTRAFPVIMLASSHEERGAMQSYKLGASGCIVKPVDMNKFIEAVAELRLGWLLISQNESA